MSSVDDHEGQSPTKMTPLHLANVDKRLLTEVVHYVLGTILLMTTRPEFVTDGQMLKRVMKKEAGPREFWTPHIIGEHYKIRREYIDHGGTHSSPRFHWVRGFYRQQSYGAGSTFRRQQWVEPYMRGLATSVDGGSAEGH